MLATPQNETRVTLPLCDCADNELAALGASFDLSLSFRDLFLIRDHYRRHEKRDPALWEMKLLQSILRAMHNLPQSVLISSIEGSEADRRIFADLQKKALLLGKKPNALSLDELVKIARLYMTHCGLAPHEPTLRVADAASATIRPADADAPLMTGAHAALLARRHTPKKSKRAQNLLLLLRNDGKEGFAERVNRFLHAAEAHGAQLITRIGGEGLLPHLLTGSHGLTLDLAPIDAEIDTALAACATFGVGDVLLKAPECNLREIAALGAPLCAIGRITADERLSVFHGRQLLFSFSLRLLALLGQSTTMVPQVQHAAPVKWEELSSTGLYSITLSGDCLTALCEWLCNAVLEGADLNRASLCTLLTLPNCQTETVGAALAPLLAFHRFACELALPISSASVAIDPSTAPRLSVFMHAEVKRGASTIDRESVQAALSEANFAALRALLRK